MNVVLKWIEKFLFATELAVESLLSAEGTAHYVRSGVFEKTSQIRLQMSIVQGYQILQFRITISLQKEETYRECINVLLFIEVVLRPNSLLEVLRNRLAAREQIHRN